MAARGAFVRLVAGVLTNARFAGRCGKPHSSQAVRDHLHWSRFRVPHLRREPSQVSCARMAEVGAKSDDSLPGSNFLPDTGLLRHVLPPPTSPNVRMETGFNSGDEISVRVLPTLSIRELTLPQTGLLRSPHRQAHRPRLFPHRGSPYLAQGSRRVPDRRPSH